MKVADAVALLKSDRGVGLLLAYALYAGAERTLVARPDVALALYINDYAPAEVYVSALWRSIGAPTRAEKKKYKNMACGMTRVEVGDLAFGVGLMRRLLFALQFWDYENVETLEIVRIDADGAETVALKLI